MSDGRKITRTELVEILDYQWKREGQARVRVLAAEREKLRKLSVHQLRDLLALASPSQRTSWWYSVADRDGTGHRRVQFEVEVDEAEWPEWFSQTVERMNAVDHEMESLNTALRELEKTNVMGIVRALEDTVSGRDVLRRFAIEAGRLLDRMAAEAMAKRKDLITDRVAMLKQMEKQKDYSTEGEADLEKAEAHE